jgi:hypothetical protein
MRSPKAADEFKHWLGNRIDERCGKTGRERDAKPITIAGRIFNRDETAFARNPKFEKAAGAEEAVDGFEESGIYYAASEFFAGEIAET